MTHRGSVFGWARWVIIPTFALLVSANSNAQDTPACRKFDQWKQGVKDKAVALDVGQGQQLAKERRAELKQLITRNPKLALKNAIPKEDRGLFTQEVSALLEDEVSGQGYVGPLMATRFDDTNAVQSVSVTVHGQVLRVFLHGRQFSRKQWWDVPVKGIAIDGLAVLEDEASDETPAPPRVVKTKTITRSYDAGQVKVSSRGGFDDVELKGLGRLEDEPGTPWLPAETISVALPSGADVRGIKVRFEEEKIRDGVVPPPVQPPIPKIPDADTTPVPPKAEAYSRNEVLPQAVATIVGDHNMLGHRYVSLRINPLRYNAATKTLYAVSDLSIALDYEPPVVMPSALPGAAVSGATEAVKRLVVNPADVEAPAVPGAVGEAVTTQSSEIEPLAQDLVGFSAASYSVQENGGNAVISVARTSAGNYVASADYTTVNGTAAAGTEYTATTGTLSWAAREGGTKTFSVPVSDDLLVDGNKAFYVCLNNIVGASANMTNATVTILDNEVPGTLSFVASSNTVGENGGSLALSVQRTVGKFGAVSVQYFTSNGTASAGTDFVSATGTLTWADGDDTNKTINITILNDTVYQNTHSFTVRLKNPVSATLGSPSNSLVTITEDDPRPGQIDYLIITSDALVPAFTNLAVHRQTYNGFVTEMRTVSNISTSYAGGDTQAKIKACIADYLTTRSISYVVLGGDDTVVPVRRCYVVCGSYTCSDMPTDLYYSGLDSTWNEDGDGTYGEASASEGDLAYDVVVGRIPVRSTAQANAYINKLINYNNNPPYQLARKFMLSGHQCWYSYGGTDRPTDDLNDGNWQFDAANHPTVSDSEMYVRRNYRDKVQASGWSAETVGCMFESLTSWDAASGGDYQCSPANLVTKYNLGWNFLFNDTHGNTDILAHEGGYFTSSYANQMTNLTVIFYTGACLSGGFDSGEPSLSEAMLRNPNGGSLIYLGCSRYGWGQTDAPPADSGSTGGTSPAYAGVFWQKIFASKLLMVGKAFAEHKLYYAGSSGYDGSYRWVQFGLNLQGDPAMNIIGVKPFVSVEATDPLSAEPGSDTAQFTIHREPATNSLTVYLSFSGSATLSGGSSDIAESLPASVTFADGESDKVITITPVVDGLVESNETVIINLTANANYELGSKKAATITIVDTDNPAPPVVAIAATDSAAAEQGSNPGVFTFTRTGSSASDVTIAYAVSGSASPADYLETLSGSIAIPGGQTTTNITITPVDDPLPEGNESLTLTLQAGSYTISSGTATVVIAENETAPTVTISATDSTARENSADTGNFRITRTGNTTLALNVSFAVGGTCTPGSDYIAASSPATITSGATYVDLPIVTTNDSLPEAVETVQITLTAGAGYYAIGSSSQAVVNVTDDDNTAPQISDITNCVTAEDTPSATLAFTVADAETAPGSLTLSRQSGNLTLVPLSGIVFGGSVSNRTVTVTPATNQTGSATITVTVTDAHGLSASDSFVISVSPVNDAPVASGQNVFVQTNTPKAILLAATDVDSGSLTYTVVTNPSRGTLSGTAPNLVYSPDTGYEGSDYFTFRANDGLLDGNVATVNITVASIDPSMIAWWRLDEAGGSNAVDTSGCAHTGLLQATAAFIPGGKIGGALQLTSASDMFLSSPVVPLGAAWTICAWFTAPLPNTANWHTLTRAQSGDHHVITDSSLMLGMYDNTTAGNFRSCGYSMSGLSTGWHHVAAVATGTITKFYVDGVYVGTSDRKAATSDIYAVGNYQSGGQRFADKIDDVRVYARELGAAEIAGIASAGQNLAPAALDDSYSVLEDAVLSVPAPGVLGNDTDPELGPLTATRLTDPSYGTLSFSANGSFTYTPDAGWSGVDTFTYKANDGALDSAPATVTITVVPRIRLVSAQSVGSTSEVTVLFNKSVTLASSQAPTNYSLDKGVTVQTAVRQADLCTVKLAVTGMQYGQLYTLTVNNVLDNDGFAVATNSQAQFTCSVDMFDAFSCRESIRLAGYGRPEALTNFTALVKVGTNMPGFSYAQFESPLGYDLRFSDGAKLTELKYEVESWNTNGTSLVWVQVPLLSGTNTVIWAYWGNAAVASAPAVYTTNGAPWETGFSVVAHMSKATPVDSTTNQNNGTVYGSVSQNVAGLLSGSDQFDGGLANYIKYGSLPSRPANNFTFSAWVKPSQSHEIDGESNSSTTGISGQKYAFSPDQMGADGGAGLSVGTNGISVYEHGDGYMPPLAVYSGPVGSGWSYVSVAYVNKKPTIYLNGLPVRSNYTSPKSNVWAPLSIGSHSSYGGFPGMMDEVRIESVSRSSNWIWACWMNMASNELFNSYGVVQGAANQPPDAGDDGYSVNEDTLLTVSAPGVLANDSDPNADPLNASIVAAPVHGDLTLNSNGSFSYMPDTDYYGVDSFVYMVSDGSLTATATVSITVNSINDLPTCQIVDPTNSAIVAAGAPLTIAAAFSDVDGICTQTTFYADNTNVIGVTFTCPSSVIWANPSLGAHSLKIVCRDDGGAVCTSAVVSVTTAVDTDGDAIPDIYDTDDDNDGIPDAWENTHGLGSTVSNSMQDADSDGMPNLYEYIAGTDPTNAASVFGIMSVSNNSGFIVNFLTVTNRVYGVDWCDDLQWVDWLELTSSIAGNGLGKSVVDTNTAAGARFYRIRVKLP